MLEPFVRPRGGLALNAFGAILCVAGLFMDAGVTSAAGEVPGVVIMPLLITFFVVRVVGIQAGVWRELAEMPWGYRFTSWGALALALLVLGLLTTRGGAIFFGVVVALDAAGALAPRRPGEAQDRDYSGLTAWMRRRAIWVGALYVFGLAVVHFVFALGVPYGPLLDWAYVVAGFALLMRFGAIGRREPDAAALPPAPHRVHEARVADLPDPLARGATDACDAFLRGGDAGPLMDVVRDVARHAHLDPPAARDLESRVFAALARAGTAREDDLSAAIAALEDALPEPAPAATRLHVHPSDAA